MEEILEDFADFLLRETVDGHSDVSWSVTTINVDLKVQGQRSCGQKKLSLIKTEGKTSLKRKSEIFNLKNIEEI